MDLLVGYDIVVGVISVEIAGLEYHLDGIGVEDILWGVCRGWFVYVNDHGRFSVAGGCRNGHLEVVRGLRWV